jgi:hypothetical protein
VFAKRSGKSHGYIGISRSLQIKDDRKFRAAKWRENSRAEEGLQRSTSDVYFELLLANADVNILMVHSSMLISP